MGLDNVRQRLRLMYGDAARLTVQVDGGETLVVIDAPSASRSQAAARLQAVVAR